LKRQSRSVTIAGRGPRARSARYTADADCPVDCGQSEPVVLASALVGLLGAAFLSRMEPVIPNGSDSSALSSACSALSPGVAPAEVVLIAATSPEPGRSGSGTSRPSSASSEPSAAAGWDGVSRDYLRTRNRRMVTAPGRVLLTGSRSILARPGDEKRMPPPSSTGSTYTRISSTRPPPQALAGHVSTEDFEVPAARSVQCRGDRFPDVTGEERDRRVRRVRRLVGQDEHGSGEGVRLAARR
jgi:hypothetical protein